MPKEVKNTISHRLRALDQFKQFINSKPELLLGDIITDESYDPEWDVIDCEDGVDDNQTV